jgi:hypothetical protein
MSHATARPRQAGKPSGSQTQNRPAGGSGANPTGTPQRYRPGSLPSRPDPQRLRTIRRLGARSAIGGSTTLRDCLTIFISTLPESSRPRAAGARYAKCQRESSCGNWHFGHTGKITSEIFRHHVGPAWCRRAPPAGWRRRPLIQGPPSRCANTFPPARGQARAATAQTLIPRLREPRCWQGPGQIPVLMTGIWARPD